MGSMEDMKDGFVGYVYNATGMVQSFFEEDFFLPRLNLSLRIRMYKGNRYTLHTFLDQIVAASSNFVRMLDIYLKCINYRWRMV